MSRRSTTALCFICAILIIFNMLASVSVFATPEGDAGTTSDTTLDESTTVDPDAANSSTDSETTTEHPDQTTSESDVTPPPSTKTAVSFEVTIPADFPTAYRTGDVFSTEGIIGTITYDDGTTAPTTEIFTDAPDFLEPDETDTVVISFFCDEARTIKATATLSITIAAITNIEFSGESVTAEYYEGDIFGTEQIEALIITVFFADGSSKQVEPDECTIIGRDAPLSINAPEIFVIYCGAEYSFTLNIIEIPEITEIQIIPSGSFNKYFTEGDTFNPAGLMIMAIYSGGKNPEVIASDINGFANVEFSPALDVPLKFTDTVVTVTYSDGTNVFTAEQSIVVSSESVASIKVSKDPNKMVYNEGETFDYTGMELTITYNDGSTVVVSDNFEVTYANIPVILKSNSTESVDIEITYLDKSCTLSVNVIPAEIASVTVLSKPAKLTYNEGETFDPLGLVLVPYIIP